MALCLSSEKDKSRKRLFAMTAILQVVLLLSAPHMSLRASSIDARVVDMPAGEDPNSFFKDIPERTFSSYSTLHCLPLILKFDRSVQWKPEKTN